MNKHKRLLLLLSSFLLLITSIGSQLFTVTHADLSFGLCDTELGAGLQENAVISSVRESDLPTVGNRIYTVDELFSKSYDNATPYGIIEKGTILSGKNNEAEAYAEDSASTERMKKWGNSSAWSCPAFPLGNLISNTTTSIGQSLTKIIQMVVVSLFSDDFVCNPNSTNTSCMNILGIVAGKNNNDKSGLISKFGEGFFIPLQVLAFVFTGLWILYKGIIKREFRASLGGFVWAIFTLFLGVIFVMNPYTFARMPQQINGAISECIMGALTGDGCQIGPQNELNADENSICVSKSTSVLGSNALALRVNGLSCGITKAFNIDRWSMEQFGYPFDALWVSGYSGAYPLYTNYTGSASDYCVNMGSSSSPNQLGSYPRMNSQPRCNIALAFIAKKTVGDFGVKASMGQFVGTAAKDEAMWAAFTGSAGRTGASGFFSNLGILLAAIAFIPVTIFSHAYSITATILMGFAPLFFLFGLHPGKGKKIFLGWVETIVSSMLKYMASALLTLVMVLMFGAALSQLSAFKAFIAIIVLDVTFLMYRKEFMNLIGSVSLGGEKVKNRAAEAMDKIGKNAKQYAGAGMGGAIAGTMTAIDMAKHGELGGGKQVLAGLKEATSGVAKGKGFKEKSKALAKGITKAKDGMEKTAIGQVASGTKSALGMEARRGNGVVATAARQYKMTTDKLESDRDKNIRTKMERDQDFALKKNEILENVDRKNVSEELKNTGLHMLNDDIVKSINEFENINSSENPDHYEANKENSAVLSTHKAEIEMKVERTSELMDSINDNGGDVLSGLKDLGHRQSVNSINQTEANVNSVLNKLSTLRDGGAIDDETYEKMRQTTLDIQEKSLKETNIQFIEDLKTSWHNDEINPETFHQAWDNFNQRQTDVSSHLEQLHRATNLAISEMNNQVARQMSSGSYTAGSEFVIEDTKAINEALSRFDQVAKATEKTVSDVQPVVNPLAQFDNPQSHKETGLPKRPRSKE